MAMPPVDPYSAQAESPSGLGPEVGKTAAWLMAERTGTTARTMLRGPSKNTFFRTMFGFSQTSQEMSAWVGGKGTFTGRTTGLSWAMRTAGLIPEDRGILGSMYTPSSWIYSAILGSDPSKYGSWGHNVANGRWSPSAWQKNIEAPGRTFMAGGRIHGRFAKPVETTIIPGQPQEIHNIVGNAWDKMTPARASETMNKMLGIGGSASSSYVKDFALGTMFKELPMEGSAWPLSYAQRAKSYQRMSGYTGRGNKAVNWLGATLSRGQNMAARGVDPTDFAALGGGITSKFGNTASRGLLGASVALRAYGYIQLGIMAGEVAFKGAALYYYKLPKSVASSVGAQLMRPAFSSGDSSLLSGIPANNRMRAVQAIQGSRLNARGALGSEASMMSGHFG